jgi:lysophospholipase L1-like esterase
MGCKNCKRQNHKWPNSINLIWVGIICTINFLFLSSFLKESIAGVPTRMMLLGDSITEGIGSIDGSGYRRVLYHFLSEYGYSVKFVGNLGNGPFDFDRKHEGHQGYTAEQISKNIYKEGGNWLGNQPADIIILHIGTNDISYGKQNVFNIEEILNKIDRFEADYNISVTVVLARIILRSQVDSYYQATKDYNNEIESMASSRINRGDKLILVDMESVLNYASDMADNLHPNDSGYKKLADAFFNVLTRVLSQGEQFKGQYIAQDKWLVHYVDSEETIGENAVAENAIDGRADTIWHTKWYNGIESLPHELQIDLGRKFNIDGFKYLPRQNMTNGRIAEYSFYVSTDAIEWGSPVARGKFSNTKTEQNLSFRPTVGRFIRLVAHSEVNGNNFISASEINLTQSYSQEENYPPNGSITQPIKPLTIKVGEFVDFEGIGSDSDMDFPLKYIWSFGEGSGIGDIYVSDPQPVQFNHGGVFEVRFQVCDNLGVCDPSPASRTVTVGGVTGLIPREGWSVVYVDSQEVVGENASAENVFDGNASTIWHSEWYQRVDPLPNEIQIDLGDDYAISGFNYLPRQNMANGRIADYAFYVSVDGEQWGSPVVQGRFPNTKTEQKVSFTPTAGRFIRLVALSEVNGNSFTSVAELNVLGY